MPKAKRERRERTDTYHLINSNALEVETSHAVLLSFETQNPSPCRSSTLFHRCSFRPLIRPYTNADATCPHCGLHWEQDNARSAAA